MAGLASVIKDLDKDCPNVDEDSLCGKFSQALARFNHGLVSSSTLSEELQVSNSD